VIVNYPTIHCVATPHTHTHSLSLSSQAVVDQHTRPQVHARLHGLVTYPRVRWSSFQSASRYSPSSLVEDGRVLLCRELADIAHALCLKKTSPFLFLWYLCQISSDSANFWQKHAPGNLKQKHVHGPIHISFYMFTLYLTKTSDASERTQRRRPLPVRLLIEPECRNFFKSLCKLLTLQPLSENSRITTWRGRLRACMRTDGRDFKHLLG